MSESTGSNNEDKKTRARRQPKPGNVLTPTFAASRQTASSGWEERHQQGDGLLQRQCACGTHTIGGGPCDACRRKAESSVWPRTAVEAVPESAETPTVLTTDLSYDLSQVPVHTAGLQPQPAVQARFIDLDQSTVPIQRLVDPLSAAGFGLALFGTVSGLVPYGNEGLKWTRNVAKAIHPWPPDQTPTPDDWVRDHFVTLLSLDFTHGYSNATAEWRLQWNYNGADIDQVHVIKHRSSSWAGGYFGSEVDVTFEMQDASASYERDGVSAMICYINGKLDPTGPGDIDFEGRIIIFADGTSRRLDPDLRITRGTYRGLSVLPYGAGWEITNRFDQ